MRKPLLRKNSLIILENSDLRIIFEYPSPNLIGKCVLYLLKNSYRENRRYDIVYVLCATLKTFVEKLGDM
jgi:hypothetical protein